MVVTKRSASVADRILGALDERGYRSTAPRRALASAIGEQDGHFTAENLRKLLPQTLGRATVYRTLKLLVDADVLCRVMLEDGDLRYQLSHQGHHHHLLCVVCGSSQDLTGCDIEDVLVATSARHGFELSGHWLEVYGRCGSCVDNLQAAD